MWLAMQFHLKLKFNKISMIVFEMNVWVNDKWMAFVFIVVMIIWYIKYCDVKQLQPLR